MSERKKYVRVGLREKMIRKLQSMGKQGYAFERVFVREFTGSQRAEVEHELSVFLSEGFVHRLGTGKRGDPYRICLSATWPFNKCPLCGHIEFPTPQPKVKE